MTLDELKRLFEGPLAAYLSGECSYGAFADLLNREFDLDITNTQLYPLMFNIRAKEPDPKDWEFLSWDIWKAGKAYFGPIKKARKEQIEYCKTCDGKGYVEIGEGKGKPCPDCIGEIEL